MKQTIFNKIHSNLFGGRYIEENLNKLAGSTKEIIDDFDFIIQVIKNRINRKYSKDYNKNERMKAIIYEIAESAKEVMNELDSTNEDQLSQVNRKGSKGYDKDTPMQVIVYGIREIDSSKFFKSKLSIVKVLNNHFSSRHIGNDFGFLDGHGRSVNRPDFAKYPMPLLMLKVVNAMPYREIELDVFEKECKLAMDWTNRAKGYHDKAWMKMCGNGYGNSTDELLYIDNLTVDSNWVHARIDDGIKKEVAELNSKIEHLKLIKESTQVMSVVKPRKSL